ncbi:1-phosphofructokinase [Treponema phagedenis]|uniref:1-phosphofructokinase n=1 Tax=Treponema phagedenis TaxID=162 RepID=UPI0001F63D5A|nr:1-phosphofructokinase [Treponema phagedenis]EFW37342.1 1-phosphofructokinase [Treponema phagedenis F0421]TYT79143.1 1-phosphofructokinase [Treponema phagedenis]
MIYTVTINPSLDYIIDVPNFQTGVLNRVTAERINVGGKGINVSLVLRNLGFNSIALGFAAGFTGDKICAMLSEKGITNDFISVKNGISRINVKLRSDEETEMNGQGPSIEAADVEKLFSKIAALQDDDILVLAGSIPSTLSSTLYVDIMKLLQKKKTKIIVDATKDLLKNTLPYKPFLIKPNKHELSEIFDTEITTTEEIIFYAKKIRELGAQNVLISMAGDGALFINEKGSVYQSAAPKGKKVNSVGAGDSMVAGFIAGFLETNSYTEAFKMGLCTGSASAFSEELAKRYQVEELLKNQQFNF